MAFMNEPLEYSPQQVGRRLVALRAAYNVAQKDFAESIGVTSSLASNWEAGRSRPGLGHALSIVQKYRVNLDWLFLGRTESLPHQLALKLIENMSAYGKSGQATRQTSKQD